MPRSCSASRNPPPPSLNHLIRFVFWGRSVRNCEIKTLPLSLYQVMHPLKAKITIDKSTPVMQMNTMLEHCICWVYWSLWLILKHGLSLNNTYWYTGKITLNIRFLLAMESGGFNHDPPNGTAFLVRTWFLIPNQLTIFLIQCCSLQESLTGLMSDPSPVSTQGSRWATFCIFHFLYGLATDVVKCEDVWRYCVVVLLLWW